MKTFRFKKIDAFATAESAGNPAGAIYLDRRQDITVDEMARIARELKGFVGEVGYVARLDDETLDLRYYSSEREVDFCGHATIAIMYDLLKNSPDMAKKQFVTIFTSKGTLVVENRIDQEDGVFISAPSPVFSNVDVAPEPLAQALGIPAGEIGADYPLAIVDAGLETLLVPIAGLDPLLSMTPPFEDLARYCQETAIDIVTVFSDQVADPANAYRTRVFAPTFGYLEDPATGSGNAALGCYLLKHGRWDGSPISLEQNGERDRPNTVRLLARPGDPPPVSYTHLTLPTN